MHYGFVKQNSLSNVYQFRVLARMRTINMFLSFCLNEKRYFLWKAVTGFSC